MPLVHYSRRSRRAPAHVAHILIDHRLAKPSWHSLASQHGYRYFGRDPKIRAQVYLRCLSCDGVMAVHTHVLRTARPECTSCYLRAMAREATAAGLEFLRPCPHDSHRGIYRASCGHEVSRQRVFVQKIGAGKVALRCETCLENRNAAEARKHGWILLGAPSNGDPNYRRYLHHGCSHQQDITVSNMLSGRFACHSCSEGWLSDTSYIYLDYFELPDGAGEFVKVGMSRRPEARLRHQFDLADGVHAEVLEKIRFDTGAEALRAEKQIHKTLRDAHPEWVVSAEELDWIGVTSEIYRIEALPRIRKLFADLRARTEA
ncbi:GIY-YIG nuclease family protein [Donghicola tyrosinivorans]|uniref:T5orf172 domain-containing protein n=1 Tax=Donghicola tyrosinivorans TaxID=1652492 RepID=A0A2T0W898_9RHOB|nr:GIY-YIG nuclease family protein [Donghicola tyrosinivorans]PRY82922.1 T5orf172 domain-containing protein [Donghicola tyrosinivorans]